MTYLSLETETDLDGNYLISNIDPGNYDVEFTYIGYQTQKVVGMIVKAGQSNKLNQKISEGVLLQEAIIVGYKAPLIDFDNTTQGKTITSDDIRSLPTKNINAIAATSAGLTTVDDEISVRGSRPNATNFYIDGVRVSSTNGVPQSEIDQLQVITGGLDAKYGDVTGGVISITTKGPSQQFTGGVEVETSEYLDSYGYNLVSANISGPILKNSDDETILGFRFSGQGRDIHDAQPYAFGIYRASESLISDLEQNPTTLNSGEEIARGETLQLEDIGDPLKARPNNGLKDLNVTGKLDARLSDNIDITLSGSYYDSEDRFLPTIAYGLLNWQNNPILYENAYRGNFRFRHKLGKQSFGEEKTDEEKASNTVIRNATYSIQVGYEKSYDLREDIRHQDNFFDYGYYGRTERAYRPIASFVTDTSLIPEESIVMLNGLPFAHQGYLEEAGDFAINPNANPNPVLARYNQTNGLPNENLSDVWGLWNNVGSIYNRFEKNESDRYTLNVASSFDFLPGGSEKGRHSIQFGVTYEQRVDRRFVILPERLWQIASSNVNRHITGVDFDNVVGTQSIEVLNSGGLFTDFPVHGALSQADEFSDLMFFRKVRELTGKQLNEYVNVDELNPSDLSLDMFSAAEINNTFINTYYGFDYLGNKVNSTVSFDDFFTSKDGNGIRNFLVAPLQPIYGAGYLQDKFTFRDIIMRVGVRVDYFDANTKVLKDPYSLYEVESAADFYGRNGGSIPGSISSDYKVYVAGEDSEDVIGYRLGDQWFSPNGTRVSGGNILFGGGLVHPSYKERDDQKRNIQNEDFDPNQSFEDYNPQLNIMPRVAFSFPISEDAGFLCTL